MKTRLFSSPGALALGALIVALAAQPAQASAATRNTSSCTERAFTQAFLPYKDTNWYTPVQGQDSGGFNAAGWALTGGAKVITTTLPDGGTGRVLDLPSNARAVSPIECVTSSYPTARSFVINVKGSEGIAFEVEYEATSTWGKPKNTGQMHGGNGAWELSAQVNLQPEGISGWQPMRIVLVGKGTTSDFRVYDLQIDPRLAH